MSPKNLFRVLFICLLLAGGTTVFANGGQPGGGQGGPAGGGNQGPRGGDQPPALPDSTQIVQIVEEMDKALSLTAEQKVRISDLYFAHFAEARKIVDQATGDRDGQRRKMEGLRDDFEKEMKAELNDEQKAQFEKMAKSRRARPGPSDSSRR
ncbi:MAG: hypothetical protein QNL91_09265 [Candidatus Krumholzibacteria bacterium]|nr:hypothetical protein [Candidatus Krumholzibacteria bacterium]